MRRWRPAIPTCLLAFALLVFSAVAPAQAQNRFWLVNETGAPIEAAFVAATRVSAWGPDILAGAAIRPGDRVWVAPLFTDCMINLRIVLRGGQEQVRREVNACRLAEVTFRPVERRDPSFTFANQSGRTIRELYVSLSTEAEWGRDRLGSDVLRDGQALRIELPAGDACAADMLVIYMDDTRQERRRVETCGLGRFAWR